MKTLCTLFLLLILNLFKQDKILIVLESKPEIFACDHFDNVYVYTKNILKRFNSVGIDEAQYSSLSYGHLNSLDVSDPMQLTLFYKDFNLVQLLDNKLNPIGEPLYLDKLGFTSVDCVCKSRQGGIWIFDSFAQKLVLYSFSNRSIVKEIDILRYTKPIIGVDNIVESGTDIYFYKKQSALNYIDQMGGSFSIAEIYPTSMCQFFDDYIVYVCNKNLMQYSLKSGETRNFGLDGFKEFDDIKSGNKKLFILKGDSLTIINKPNGF
jgi:hypothetical protein